jgi:hypothetical protein
MPSEEYYDGRNMEINPYLHDRLVRLFEFDTITSVGSPNTKIDILGTKGKNTISFSVKNVSGKNTQIHLTTLKKFSVKMNVPQEIIEKLRMWLGDNDQTIFDLWKQNKNLSKYEIKHQRLKSSNIEKWEVVEKWFNDSNNKNILPRLLVENLKESEKINFIVWVNKKTKNVKIIDTEKLIRYINEECEYITMPRGTVIRCITPNNKPILWLQIKGNRTDDGYNHSPQFHIVDNWPNNVIFNEFSL